MFLELIAVVVAGIAAAIFIFALSHLFGGAWPRWLMPVAAGLAMLGATISLEYGWYARTTANLPEGFVVAEAVESPAIYRPWTYLLPFVTRFNAVDTANFRTHKAVPGQRIAEVYFYGRWSPLNRVSVLFDCEGQRRAPLVEGVTFNEDGSITGTGWAQVTAEDPLLATACAADPAT